MRKHGPVFGKLGVWSMSPRAKLSETSALALGTAAVATPARLSADAVGVAASRGALA